jgi:RNA polymerase sigma factor (sigma-70 family)
VAHVKDKPMLTQQTAINYSSAALNIAELADRYTGLLHGIGRRYRLTPEVCDDAAQSTWLALCQSAERIRDPERIPGWLATSMRRFCAAAIRRRHREQPASHLLNTDAYTMADPAGDIADTVAARHTTTRLYQAIAQLPDRERRLIQLQLHSGCAG